MQKKFKYLYQLVFLSIVLVIVPTLFYFNTFWKKSYEEINVVNEKHYEEVLSEFLDSFLSEISEFKQYAANLSLKSRNNLSDSGFLYEATENMEKNNYYYYKTAQDLADNSRNAGYDKVGIYFYEKDILLTNGAKYTSKKYIENGQKINEHAWKVRLEEFFAEEQYEKKKLIFTPLPNKNGSVELLVGYCTYIGKNKEKVLIFNQITKADTEVYNSSPQERAWIKYYVLDSSTEEIMYYMGDEESEGIFVEEVQHLWIEESSERNMWTTLNDQNNWYAMKSDVLDFIFLIDTSEDEIQNNVMSFYHDMKMFLYYIIFIMAAICIIMVYLNYRPIHRLLKNIKYNGQNEFEAILEVWNDQKSLLTKQRIMLLDLLMNHMIYGIPISEEYVKELGVSSRITNYCVFLIKNKVLNAMEMDQIVINMEETFGALLFATDLTGENATVMIACMESDAAEEIKYWMEMWCAEHLDGSYELKMGRVVHKMDQIRKSFLDCIRLKKDKLSECEENISDKVRNRSEINEKLKEDVLNYIDEHYTDANLSQTDVTDYFQISVYSLTKMFNNQIGMGFVKYVTAKRIEYAKELLTTTELTVKDISNMVGIPDDNYFARIFRKYTDVSPSEFREKNNK